jgi:hypothetical protein
MVAWWLVLVVMVLSRCLFDNASRVDRWVEMKEQRGEGIISILVSICILSHQEGQRVR